MHGKVTSEHFFIGGNYYYYYSVKEIKNIMRLLELDWIMDNFDKLSIFEQKQLEKYNIHEHYEKGTLSMPYHELTKFFHLIKTIHKRYSGRGE
jgi:hypothetical protein